MAARVPVYLEIGTRRVFASAVEWPGWCRSGRDEDGALQALLTSASRYAEAIGQPARGFPSPTSVSAFDVAERLEGNATTDFGAPGIAAVADERPLAGEELDRHRQLLEACWAAFDAAAERHAGAELRKGPRGGGRELPAIVEHVLDADASYLHGLGGRHPKQKGEDPATEMARLREAIRDTLALRGRGETPETGPRRRAPLWASRYFVRRSAWHAIDHAWEIEDRAISP